MPAGLDTIIGFGGRAVTAAHAQQIALTRLVLDSHTLVLDEATPLIDPRAARHLERSLAAVLEGRTVITLAHRLFSAQDADRVAVVEDGVISQFGSHDELVAAGGSYAPSPLTGAATARTLRAWAFRSSDRSPLMTRQHGWAPEKQWFWRR